jgi:hypothetical protein
MLFTLTVAPSFPGFEPESIINNPVMREMDEALDNDSKKDSTWRVLRKVTLLVKATILAYELGISTTRMVGTPEGKEEPEKEDEKSIVDVDEVLRTALPRLSASGRLEIIRWVYFLQSSLNPLSLPTRNLLL